MNNCVHIHELTTTKLKPKRHNKKKTFNKISNTKI